MKRFTAIPFIIVLVLTHFAAPAQDLKDIAMIEFSSVTRGSQEHIIITRDSLSATLQERGVDEPKKFCKKTTANAWNKLVASLAGVSLAGIPDLKSPTMKRAYDGARHGSLVITTHDGQSWSHGFDDEEPHEKLLPLMKKIRELAKTAKEKKR